MPRLRRAMPSGFKKQSARRQGMSQRVNPIKSSPSAPSYANPRRKQGK